MGGAGREKFRGEQFFVGPDTGERIQAVGERFTEDNNVLDNTNIINNSEFPGAVRTQSAFRHRRSESCAGNRQWIIASEVNSLQLTVSSQEELRKLPLWAPRRISAALRRPCAQLPSGEGKAHLRRTPLLTPRRVFFSHTRSGRQVTEGQDDKPYAVMTTC